ncbi:hypothetical protein KGD82_16590 [Nocardiopsis eucommiae]|uniref:Uncharacterized protein n=1 Tax=Nocardiopsis eucommiae TaxID=2831970 RepID=A0A975QJE1_9ACTN|nr:hypothetical protein KGD82_16590 [Nocardiopsis eucommiae]
MVDQTATPDLRHLPIPSGFIIVSARDHRGLSAHTADDRVNVTVADENGEGTHTALTPAQTTLAATELLRITGTNLTEYYITEDGYPALHHVPPGTEGRGTWSCSPAETTASSTSCRPPPTTPAGLTMSNTGLECGNLWPHDPHQYNDSGVYRTCPGLQDQPPAPAVCRSPRCTRPGTSGSGWCCYGCAAHTRFGRELLHNLPCETANPGEEETADRWMADRDRAQTALQAEVDRVFVSGCLANVNNTVDVLAPVVADLIQQAREKSLVEGDHHPRTEVEAHAGETRSS